MSGQAFKIAFVVGEESGDVLGADLLAALRKAHGGEVCAIGVGGERLKTAGLKSLFDPHEIALMGISAVVRKLPRLIGLIGKTARYIVAERPDCLIIIDSPDFTHRVARKVRAALPSMPIVNYVCPSVWAWRQARAKAMSAYVDEVLAILPFEVEAIEQLRGPKATYVGHRLAQDGMLRDAHVRQMQIEPDRFSDWGRPIELLCLPGSRTGEIDRHISVIADILAQLKARHRAANVRVHVLERHAALVKQAIAKWPFPVLMSHDERSKSEAFSNADVAIAASGTVTLELALAGVPTVSIYRLDRIARFFRHLVKIWTASLPNLIADQVIVPEYIDEMIRPGLIARQIEQLARPGPARDVQIQGFDLVRERMQTERPSGQIAAERVLACIAQKRAISGIQARNQ
jgi:lipid-A-disaccharide synthase